MAPQLLGFDCVAFVLDQLDKAGLGRHVFSEEALALIARSADGILRRACNIALGSLVETVRAQSRTVGIEHVNRVLGQPPLPERS